MSGDRQAGGISVASLSAFDTIDCWSISAWGASMNRCFGALATASLLVSACTGYARNEDGSIAGPNDPMTHRTYSGYSEMSYAVGDAAGHGLTKEQQICYVDVLLANIPPALADKANAYARNELMLTGREFRDLLNDFDSVKQNKTMMDTVKGQEKAKRGKQS
jgi:hypothetical protein